MSPLLLDRFGHANMQINQEEEGFPMEWEIPGSEQLFPKISNGHNSLVLRDNIWALFLQEDKGFPLEVESST